MDAPARCMEFLRNKVTLFDDVGNVGSISRGTHLMEPNALTVDAPATLIAFAEEQNHASILGVKSEIDIHRRASVTYTS
jgi:hypothetical protein